jgi:hypothetical protein
VSSKSRSLWPPASRPAEPGYRILEQELLEGGQWRVHLQLASGQQAHMLFDGDGWRETPVEAIVALVELRLAGRD